MKYAKPIIDDIEIMTENFGYKTDWLLSNFKELKHNAQGDRGGLKRARVGSVALAGAWANDEAYRGAVGDL